MSDVINHPVHVLASQAVEGILFRLEPVRLQPKRILVIGCDFGLAATAIKERFPSAELVVKDYAACFADMKGALWTFTDTPLSIESQHVDLIVSNLLLPWCPDYQMILRDWQRLLQPGGLLIFSSYGPGTLAELSTHSLVLPHFVDMHVVGDALVQAGLSDPVMDVDHFEIRYKNDAQVLPDLLGSGMVAVDHLDSIPNVLSYEMVYGHAWKSQQQRMDEDGVVKISLDSLRAQLQK